MDAIEAKRLIKTAQKKSKHGYSNLREFRNNTELRCFLSTYKWAETIPEGIYLVLNEDIDKRPVCKECSGTVPFKYVWKGYADFCSCSCRAKYHKCHENGLTRSAVHKKTKTRRNRTPEQKRASYDKLKTTYLDNHGVDHHRHMKTMAYDEDGIHVRTRLRCSDVTLDLIRNPDKFIELAKRFPHAVELSKHLGIEKDHNRILRMYREHGIPYTGKAKSVSSHEDDISEFLSSIGVHHERNRKNLLLPTRLEIDFFIPSKNIGIEYCGLYWHNEKRKGKHYHKRKMDECNKRGIRLITIFEDEWLFKPDIVKSRLRSILGEVGMTGARLYDVTVIDNKEANVFHEKNHLQGKVIWSKQARHYALTKEEIVCAVLSIDRARYRKDGALEVLRYATKEGISGGFSRLMSRARSDFPDDTFVSYCDLRWGNGEMYRKSGFTLEKISPPSYFYFKPGKRVRYHRSKFTKSKTISMGGDPDKTEYENMLAMKYRRIWDCGCQVWVSGV